MNEEQREAWFGRRLNWIKVNFNIDIGSKEFVEVGNFNFSEPAQQVITERISFERALVDEFTNKMVAEFDDIYIRFI